MLGRRKLRILRFPAFAFPCLLVVTCSPASIHDPEVDALIEQLAEGTIEERDQAAKALIECGEKSEARLRAMLVNANSRDRRLLSDILDQMAVPKALRGVLPPARCVTILATNQSAREVLEEFQRQTGTPMRLNNVGRAPISILVNNLSPLEALDAICREAKLGWYYTSYGIGGLSEPSDPPPPGVKLHEAPEIDLSPGNHPGTPKLFIRHYAVEAANLILYPENARTGKRAVLGFRLHWPAGMNPYSVEFEVTSAIDDRGNELLRGHEDPGTPAGPRKATFLGDPYFLFYHSYLLRHPDERNSRALATVRGSAKFSYLVGEKTVAFDTPEIAVGVVKQVEGMTAEILELAPVPYEQVKLYCKARLLIKGRRSATPPLVRIRLENGRLSRPFMASRLGGPTNGVFEVHLHYPPSKVIGFEIVLETTLGDDAFDFEFKDIPFPK